MDEEEDSASSLSIKRPALAMTEDSTVPPYSRKKRKQSMSRHTSEEFNMGMEYGCGAGVEYDVDLEEEAEDMNPVDDELAEEVAMDLRGGSIRNDVSY